jgi:hypothetical protein
MENGQAETNRSNALLSTGPKTPAGKARSSKNALRHGLRAEAPVLPGERAEDWESHRVGVVRSLAPAGALEEALAGRVALCLWRLRRVTAYETAVTAVGLDEVEEEVRTARSSLMEKTDHEKLAKAEEALRKQHKTVSDWAGAYRLLQELPDLPDEARVEGDDVEGALLDLAGALPGGEDEYFDPTDADFLAGLGVPQDEYDEPFAWNGWTAGMVRQALASMAREFKTSPEKVLPRALADRKEIQESGQAEAKQLGGEIKALRRRIRDREERLRQRRMLPAQGTLETVTRYEAHLSRQLLQALHTLERLQAARAGQPVTPPAALDVTLDAGEAAAEALADAAGH